MSFQASRIQQIHSRNHCQIARFASGQNMLVKDGCIEALAKVEYIVTEASRDQVDRVDRSRLVESGGSRDDSLS